MKQIFTIITSLIFMVTSSTLVFAQEKPPVKFGKITKEDFDLSRYNGDSSASAVVVSDIGSSAFKGNNKGWFSLVFKHEKRMVILGKNGFEAANITIPLYFDGKAEERLTNLKAVTYNLEDGKVVEAKLTTEAVFKDKISKNKVTRKFTFPAVKEGSIIEYSYQVESDFLFNLQPWSFQSNYPVLWSEYEVRIPDFFRYVFITQGYNNFHINKNSSAFQSFAVQQDAGSSSRSETISVSSNLVVNRWVMKNVPALKEENFTSTMENHLSRIEFQLAEYREPLEPKNIMGNWVTASEALMKDEDFGASLNTRNNWLDNEMKVITRNAVGLLEKARLIYSYVRDNYTCTNHAAKYLSNDLKTIFRSKNGTVADINLLMIAMMRHQNIEADPVILSTRDNGFANEMYPLIHQYNYVVAEAKVEGKTYYLDASQFLGFGKLASECYNGAARVIGTTTRAVYFMSDSLNETKVTSVYMINDDEGLSGRIFSILGYYESLNVREKIKAKGEPAFFKSIQTAYNSEIDLIDPGIDSMKMLEKPVQMHYEFKLKMDEDIIYFNPLMTEGYKDNMFKSADRKYPVEMPYAFDELYTLNMEVPQNYVVEELPKSAKVSLNDGEGFFEYMIAVNDGNIQLRTRVALYKAFFLPEDYASLRDFFGYIIKKHSEHIVLKKKKG